MAQLVTAEEIATRCGVSPRQIRNLVYKRQIPFVKIGRLVRFDPDSIDRWVTENSTS